MFEVPKIAIELGELFSNNNFELALVGGSVRDLMMKKVPYDLDFTTNALPNEISKLVKPIFDDYWEVGKKFGTIGGNLRGVQIEITTYRTDQYKNTSRKPEIKFGKTLDEDLIRRDFSINAMAIKLPELEFVDLFKGVSDFANKKIRTPSDPNISFTDDPLRMMRAIRFVSTLGFEIEEETLKALIENLNRMDIISKERVRDEFTKLIMGEWTSKAIDLLVETGLMDWICKDFKLLKIEDPGHLHKDVYTHSLKVLENAITLSENQNSSNPNNDYDCPKPGFSEKDLLTIRIASLFHDIAKPQTKKVDPTTKKVSFLNHNALGAKMATKTLKDLHFDNKLISDVKLLIFMHLRIYGFDTESSWTDSAVRRLVVDAGENLSKLLILTRADVTSQNPKKVERLFQAFDTLEERIKNIQEQEELSKIRPALNGNEVMELLKISGRDVGEVMKFLMEIRMNEGEIPKEEATKRVIEKFGKQQNSPASHGEML